MKNKLSDAEKLLQKAMDESLTAAERARLEAFQHSTDGQIYVSTHNQLSEDVPSNIPEFSMSDRELDAVARQINRQLQSKRRARRIVTTTRNLALATAVFIILFLGINWLVYRDYEPEPAAPVVPTMAPTPVLSAGMKYVDVTAVTPEALEQITPGSYTQSIGQVAAAVEYDLYVPTQLKQDLSFVGAMVNPADNSVDMAFRGQSKLLGVHRLWILSQLPVTAGSKNEPLFPVQTNLNPKGETAVETILNASQTITLNGLEALYEVREYVWPMSDNNIAISVSWQENGRQYTLTVLTPSDLNPDIVMDTAKGLHLTLLEQ